MRVVTGKYRALRHILTGTSIAVLGLSLSACGLPDTPPAEEWQEQVDSVQPQQQEQAPVAPAPQPQEQVPTPAPGQQ